MVSYNSILSTMILIFLFSQTIITANRGPKMESNKKFLIFLLQLFNFVYENTYAYYLQLFFGYNNSFIGLLLL